MIGILTIFVIFAYISGVNAEIPVDSNYKGSDYCLGCHPDKQAQRTSSHAMSWQVANSSSVVGDWPAVGETKTLDFKTYAEGSSVKDASITLMHPSTDEYQVKIGDKTYNVELTYGGLKSNKWKQRYMTKDVDDPYRDDNRYILPIQYNLDPNTDTPGWQPYHNKPNWYQPSRSVEKNCAGCHNTGLSIEVNEQGYVTGYNTSEMNIGCEKCHGYLGIDTPGAVSMPVLNQNIINPDKLSKQQANEICGQCHMRGKSIPDSIFGYPWDDTTNSEFLPGENLSDYYEDHGGYYKDANGEVVASQKHHQQWSDFQMSVHYQNPKNISDAPARCFDCHEPHGLGFEVEGTEYTDEQVESNELCISCHQDYPPFNGNTSHFSGVYSGMSDLKCMKCHMTKTAKSAAVTTIADTYKLGDVHAHGFAPIEPQTSGINSNPQGLVDSCNQCHTKITQSDYEALAASITGGTQPTKGNGDVTEDGNVDIIDALYIAQYTVGLKTLTSDQKANADVTGDGNVDMIDALYIAQSTVGLRQL